MAKKKTTKRKMAPKKRSNRKPHEAKRVAVKPGDERYDSIIETYIVPMVIESRPRTEVRDVLRAMLGSPRLTLRDTPKHIAHARTLMRDMVGLDRSEMVDEQALFYKGMMNKHKVAEPSAAIKAAEGFDRVMGLDPKYRGVDEYTEAEEAERLRELMRGMVDSVPDIPIN